VLTVKTSVNSYYRYISMNSIQLNHILVLFVVMTIMYCCNAQYQQQYAHPQQQQPIQHVAQQQQQQQQQPQQQQHVYNNAQQSQQQSNHNVLHDSTRIHDKQHIASHLHGIVTDPDLSKMSEQELQFHYFKMHDNDNNNKLDGSELIKSLIHWHVEESKHLGTNAPPMGTTKMFNDNELEQMIDPILEMDDKNMDGFIDYPEFIAAQKARGF